jgi:hypothetical protein
MSNVFEIGSGKQVELPKPEVSTTLYINYKFVKLLTETQNGTRVYFVDGTYVDTGTPIKDASDKMVQAAFFK